MLSGRKANNSRLARTAVNNNESDYHDDNARHMTEQYQQVVEEIKAENKILGSLQMQQEVMKRLNERRGGDDSVVADGSIDLNNNNNNTIQRGKNTRSHNNFMQSFTRSMHKSLGSLGDAFKHLEDELNVLRKSDNSNSNNNQVMPGRRESAAIPIGYDQTIIAAQVMQDLDLSDSDDSSHDINEVFNGSESNRTSFSRKNKRPSMLRRGSSRIKGVIGRRISIKRRTSSASFGGSSSGGGDATTEEEGGGGGDNNKKKQSISSLTTEEVEQIEHLAALGCKSGNNEQSTSSSSGAFEKSITRDEDGDNDDKSTKKKTIIPSTSCSGSSSSPKRQHQPHRSTGRRRSSLFSVDEKRASITGGITGGPPTNTSAGYNNSSDDGQSSSSFSRNNSITDKSLQGSYSSKDESLICNFGRMYSMDSSPGTAADDDGTLICDWGRRQSMLSNSGTSVISNLSIQDDMALLNTNTNHHHHEGNIKDDSSLICGWDKRRQSLLSITSDVSIPKGVTVGESISEIQLQAAKESCTLFNVR